MGGMETAAETPVEPPPKRPPTKGSFKKGNKAGRHGRKGKPKWVDPPRPEGLVRRPDESQLEAMRWVVMSEKDETIQQWEMRLWLRRDPKEFLAAKLTLERVVPSQAGEPVAASGGSTSAMPTHSGAGTAAPVEPERAEVLIEKLLAEWGER